MSQDEEQLHPSGQISPASAVNSEAEESETPVKKFRITMEIPMFITLMTVSLTGKLKILEVF